MLAGIRKLDEWKRAGANREWEIRSGFTPNKFDIVLSEGIYHSKQVTSVHEMERARFDLFLMTVNVCIDKLNHYVKEQTNGKQPPR